MEIIDTHQHLWDLDRFSYTWCKDYPALNRSFGMKDYLEAVRGMRLEKSVHIEADVDEPYMLRETQYILKLAQAEDNPLAGIVACARPEKDDFWDFLNRIVEHPEIKGLRRVLHTKPDALGRSCMFIENVKVLSSYNLSFDLCVLARQLPIAIHLVQQCPGVSFILDHCGVPKVKEKALDPWRANLRKISAFPNVSCKISGLVAYADPLLWTPEDLRPFVEHTIECFGWDRVMFGSDWPVCTLSAPLQKWVETLSMLTRHASQEQRRKLFHDNAARIYKLA